MKYKVQYRTEGGANQSVEVPGTWNSNSNVSLTGLTPSTTYDIQVAAVNEKGDVGVYSEAVEIKTKPLCSDYSWQCVVTVVPVGVLLVVATAIIVPLLVYCGK